ncbi:MAG: hypothetical protein ACR2QX_12405 [Woeseiaceae bacterium]
MHFRIVTTLALWAAWLMQPAFADANLVAYASEARAEIAPRDERRTIRLPQLDFPVRAEFDCPIDAVAESVTIGIADAYQRYAPNQDDASFDAVITVPANQIAPIAAGDFCANSEKVEEDLLLSGVATAQFSLSCVAEDGRFVSFASLELPLRLVCKSDANQEPSPAVPSPAR